MWDQRWDTQMRKRRRVQTSVGGFALITTGVLMLILAVTLEAQPVAGSSCAPESNSRLLYNQPAL